MTRENQYREKKATTTSFAKFGQKRSKCKFHDQREIFEISRAARAETSDQKDVHRLF